MEGILGMEQPVEFTMGSLLDPTMALLLIGAYKNYADFVYKDYKDYMDQQKEFNKEMGDFFSYFQQDNQNWYNATKGKLLKTYDALVAQGIDPIRSVEGRAAMTQARMSIDSGELSNLRANAKASEDYMKAYLALRSQGKMDDDMNDFFLREQGYPSFRDFNTRQNGLWKAAPTEYKSLYDVTKDAFEGIKDSQISSKNGVQTVGVSDERMQAIADGLVAAGFGDSGYGKYYREKAKQRLEAQFGAENVTPLMIDKEFANDIKKQHLKEVRSIEDLDKVWSKKQDLAMEGARLAENRRQFNVSRADARRASVSNPPPQIRVSNPVFDIMGVAALNMRNFVTKGNVAYTPENGDLALQDLADSQYKAAKMLGMGTTKNANYIFKRMSTTQNSAPLLNNTNRVTYDKKNNQYIIGAGVKILDDADLAYTMKYSNSGGKKNGKTNAYYTSNLHKKNDGYRRRVVFKENAQNNIIPFVDKQDKYQLGVRGTQYIEYYSDKDGVWKRDPSVLNGRQVTIVTDINNESISNYNRATAEYEQSYRWPGASTDTYDNPTNLNK